MELQQKVAVITGAASGIGRATAERLAGGGAAVVVADINGGGAQETVARITRSGGRAIAVQVDVAKLADAHRMLAAAEQEFGGLDILCNNAGVNTGEVFSAASIEQWQRVIDVNLRAVLLGTHLAIPLLRKRGGGVIVHTASLAGIVGFPFDAVYAATKAAVVMFTHTSELLAAEGIRVNCICPGLVDTPMLNRGGGSFQLPDGIPMSQPEDIADGIIQLITDDSIAGRALQLAPGLREFAPLPGFIAP